jgi:hypothetical protein
VKFRVCLVLALLYRAGRVTGVDLRASWVSDADLARLP